VRIDSSEQAIALGSAVADIARALGMVDDGNGAMVDRSPLSPVGVAAPAVWAPEGR
jgi:hypothetical protein